MKIVGIPKSARSINNLLSQARKSNLILRSPDGCEFVLAEIDDFDREIQLSRQNRKLMEFLERRAGQAKTVALAEVRRRLGLSKRGGGGHETGKR